MNSGKIIPLTKTLQEAILELKTEWDFNVSPHLFPLYLFHYFRKKYCISDEMSLLRIEFSEVNNAINAILECDKKFPPVEGYSVWLYISKNWQTAMTFNVIIGKKGFHPHKKSNSDCLVRMGLFIYVHEGISSVKVGFWNKIKTDDGTAIEIAKAFQSEIEELMEQFNISVTKE